MSTKSVSDLLDYLFKTRLKRNGTEYSTYEVADGIRELGLGEIDPSYIAKIRRGDSKRISRDIILRLCAFFGVPASYFFPELEKYSPSDTSSDPKARISIALRDIVLDPVDKVTIEQLIDSLIQKRKLKDRMSQEEGESSEQKD